jgi:hypothetical protein
MDQNDKEKDEAEEEYGLLAEEVVQEPQDNNEVSFPLLTFKCRPPYTIPTHTSSHAAGVCIPYRPVQRLTNISLAKIFLCI